MVLHKRWGWIHNHELIMASDYLSIHLSSICVMPFRSQAQCLLAFISQHIKLKKCVGKERVHIFAWRMLVLNQMDWTHWHLQIFGPKSGCHHSFTDVSYGFWIRQICVKSREYKNMLKNLYSHCQSELMMKLRDAWYVGQLWNQSLTVESCHTLEE